VHIVEAIRAVDPFRRGGACAARFDDATHRNVRLAASHPATLRRRCRRTIVDVWKDSPLMTSTATHDDLRSRLRDPRAFFPQIGPLAMGMFEVVHNGSVPDRTIGLVQLRAGQLGR
jgi:hypothetical protein